MSRKIKSIFLLIVFSALVFHDMIPHHHEHDGDSKATLELHSKDVCPAADIDNLEHSDCSSRETNITDNNHNCPHHFHNCSVDNLEFSSSINSISIRKWDKSFDNFYLNNEDAYVFNEACSDFIYVDIRFLINKRHRIGAISLRAPPSLG